MRSVIFILLYLAHTIITITRHRDNETCLLILETGTKKMNKYFFTHENSWCTLKYVFYINICRYGTIMPMKLLRFLNV